MRVFSAEGLRRNVWFLLVVALPVTLVAVYYLLLASGEYVSESRFVIRSPSQHSGAVTTLASFVQSSSLSSGQEQAGEVMDYIRSRSALADVNRHGSVQGMFSRPDIDFLARYPALWGAPSNESLYHYYARMIDVDLDHDSGVVVLKVKAFTAGDAQQLNRQLLGLSEKLVNDLNESARSHVVIEAENRVALAEARVRKAREALAAYRNSASLLDPNKQASGVLDVATKLVSEQAALRAQLQLAQQTAPRNPGIPTLQGRIAAITAQISAQNGRVAGAPGAIASKLTDYDSLALEQEFASQNLVAASAALESAGSDAIRQQFYLERVIEPDLPDRPELPHGLRTVLTVAGMTLCIYFIGWMFIVGIIEHAPED